MKKAKIIAITGTHGTGKTTLSFLLAHHCKKKGYNVKVIQEVARSCPYPLNNNMRRETALWIYHEQTKQELEAIRDHDIVICDRTNYDSFVYSSHFRLDVDPFLQESVFNAIGHYDLVFFVRPDISVEEDGIRDIDEKMRNQIDQKFLSVFEQSSVPYIEILASDIFSNE